MESTAQVTVRVARPAELGAAGDVVRAAYAADQLVGERYLAVVGDAVARARDAEVAVAVPSDGQEGQAGAAAAPLAVLGSVTFALQGSPWSEIAAPGEGEFRMLGVHPQARGRGVGAALVRWCVDRARSSGCRALVLSTSSDMATAHRLYGRFGFVRRPDLDWTPEPGVQLLGYTLDLRAAGS